MRSGSEYGRSDVDATHFMVLSGIWDLPIFRGKSDGITKFLGGWQLSGIFTYHTGFPWTPINNNCLQTPGQQFICPIRPSGYAGGAGTRPATSSFNRMKLSMGFLTQFPSLTSGGVADFTG